MVDLGLSLNGFTVVSDVYLVENFRFGDLGLMNMRDCSKPRRGPILVTGATGYLGDAVVRAMISKGCDVVGTSRFGGTNECLIACDLLCESRVHDMLSTVNPAVIVHCAAMVPGRGSSGYDDTHAAHQSLAMTANLVRAGARKVVFTSSMTVYSPDQALPLRETQTNPSSRYAFAKLHAESVILRQADVAGVILRLPGLFGPPRTGGLINAICRAVTEGVEPTLPVIPVLWASMHVEDAADVVARAASNFPEHSLTVNVGYPGRMSINRVVRLVSDLTGRSINNTITHPDCEMDLTNLAATFGLPTHTFEHRLKEFLLNFTVRPP